MPPPPPRALLCGLLCLTLAACDSNRDTNGPARADSKIHGSIPQDPTIATTDTYVMATMEVSHTATVQTTTPVVDPATGQPTTTLTLPANTQRFAVEAGYTTAGAAAVSLYALDAPGEIYPVSVSPARTLRLRNGHLSALDAGGQPIASGNVESHLRTVLNHTGPEALTFIEGLRPASLPAAGSSKAVLDGAETVTQVTTLGSRTTLHLSLTSADPAQPPITQRKTYVATGGLHVLEEVATDIAHSTPGLTLTGISRVRFSGVHWFTNAARDAHRASGGAAATWGQAMVSPMGLPAPPCDFEGQAACQGEPGGSPGSNYPPGTYACPTADDGANLLFVHGINSSATTWGNPMQGTGVRGRSYCGMRVRVTDAIGFARGGRDRHEDQATHLDGFIRGLGGQNGQGRQQILIGHSQGGLISRRAAHQLHTPNDPNSWIRGVVTIGTPHQGANIARFFSSTGVPNVAAPAVSALSHRVIRRLVPQALTMATATNDLWQHLSSPSGTDAMLALRPESPQIEFMNQQAGSEQFPRFGIHHTPSSRWAFFRLAGDFRVEDGGPEFVRVLDAMTAKAVAATVASLFWPPAAYAAAVFISTVAITGAIDGTYKLIAQAGSQSDGVVARASQLYPSVAENDNYEAVTPTSHTGETRSVRSYAEVERVLIDRLDVELNQQ